MKFLTKQWVGVFDEIIANRNEVQDEKATMKRKWVELRSEEAEMALNNANGYLSEEVYFDSFLETEILGIEHTEDGLILHYPNGDISIKNTTILECELALEDIVKRINERIVLTAAELYYLSADKYELHLMMNISGFGRSEYYYLTFGCSDIKTRLT